MTRPTIKIHNAETNEVIDREMDDAEFAQYQIDQAKYAAEAAKAALQASAKAALLTQLGITAEQANLLLS